MKMSIGTFQCTLTRSPAGKEGEVITFIEKEPFDSSVVPERNLRLIPVFMIKNGVEFFVINRRADAPLNSNSLWAIQENDRYNLAKSMLLSNGGKFYKLHGVYTDPFELVKTIKKHGFTFTKPEEAFHRCDDERYGAGFTEFQGNINETSMCFHYRIYDEEMVRQLKAELLIFKRRNSGRKSKV